MLCRIIYYIELAQEDADRGRHTFCMGPEKVSRGADKIGDNKGSLQETWAKSEELLGSLMWSLEHCHRRGAEKHFLQWSLNRKDEGTSIFRDNNACVANWPGWAKKFPAEVFFKMFWSPGLAIWHLSSMWAQQGWHMITWIKNNGQLDRTGEVCSSPHFAKYSLIYWMCQLEKQQSQIVSITLLNFTKSHPH